MLKHYIQAARLRTLPLSISGIIVGTALARFITNEHVDTPGMFTCCFGCIHRQTNYIIFILAILTTIGFQVISNFANDYGDGVKGTDNNQRIGPERALQSGKISPKQMLRAIIFTSILTFILALLLIYTAFGKDNFLYTILFLILGISSIAAAIKYTMGKNAYGYSGFGDVFVFLFFGLLSVCGSYFLYAKQLNFIVFLPAISIGLLSTAVLNLNNMRDIKNDKNANKNTLVVKIGSKKAKKYHYFLIIGSFITVFTYTIITFYSIKQFIFLIAFIPIFKHLLFVVKNNEPVKFDPELKKLALSTFLFAILFGIGLII